MSILAPTHPTEDVVKRLRADPLSVAMFAGGIYTDHEGGATAGDEGLDVHPINPVDTPDAYTVDGDFKFLRPCLLVQVSTETQLLSGSIQQMFLKLSGLQAQGYSEARDGLARVRQVLDKTGSGTFLPPNLTDTAVGYYIEYLDTPGEGLTDPSVITGNGKRPACLTWARYLVYTEPIPAA